ncbi:helix-turn-helix transcriptional regulator [Sphingorhabdus soli]|uniref:Helix-turn-helix transcriptional regulator n=1 Tax=Flavisphingopyxis soli TaxID=2601267 RepID=A0A5C6UKJ1_9SPHN|nr:metalloregulator ArsR/SmtB family transcription factor [Sphingorhabdus soli]TXC73397.1 helix-turn-helix transcriptional regulator [Sphingorhabdus soli]
MNTVLDDMTRHADVAADMLKALAHPARLLVLCHLVDAGELAAGELGVRAGLSQSAMSQHLAKLREQGLVETHRQGTVVRYRIADANAARLLALIHELYCHNEVKP